jgi:proteasome lid subunit RPN8/RPN11
VLDDIRLSVVDAFFRAPRGGVEIGGVLLGALDGNRLRITGYAPLDCEHAFGPSFTLSERDQERLAELLKSAVPPGLRAVGWYHSHTRSEIFFSGPDLEIHQRFFPEPWQVALVLRPHTFQPTRAGFFFREQGGSIQGEASYAEFTLDPLPPRPVEVEPAPSFDVGQPGPPAVRAAAGIGRRVVPLLALLACLAAALLAYDVFRLQADLQAQTERANRAEKSLAGVREQLKIEQEKSTASAPPYPAP